MSEKMLKQIAWENAKGALRASVAAVFVTEPLSVSDGERIKDQWADYELKVEDFITEIENHGLSE